ncbi:transcriptional regulator, partial [Enterococcus hirae]
MGGVSVSLGIVIVEVVGKCLWFIFGGVVGGMIVGGVVKLF